MRSKAKILLILLSWGMFFFLFYHKKKEPAKEYSTDAISPFSSNSYYWQYKGKPVMLLGGSKDDNLFQISNLEAHLDLMNSTGANYIRNTMNIGEEGVPFKKLSNGKYDIDQWNDKYWNRFEKLLRLTAERGIFVQIELWDQWDHNQKAWNSDPWNPDQNVNYNTSDTRLKGDHHYQNVLHDTNKRHDLFLTVPKIHNDSIVLSYQQKFIDKILSHTFQYDHVLYTVDNELFTQHSTEWSLYWMDYVHNKAEKSGNHIHITEMFQEEDITSGHHQMSLDNPNLFDYFEASQNAGKSNQEHWDNLQWVRNYIFDQPRPINHTKIYGGDEIKWTKGDKQGIERFWRSIVGGAASVRFHRPPYGIGLSPKAQTQIRSARMLLSEFNIFKARPDAHSTLLYYREPDEAYLSYVPGEQYAVYFPEGGSVEIDLTSETGRFELKWLNINKSTWNAATNIHGRNKVMLDTPEEGSWVAFISIKSASKTKE